MVLRTFRGSVKVAQSFPELGSVCVEGGGIVQWHFLYTQT